MRISDITFEALAFLSCRLFFTSDLTWGRSPGRKAYTSELPYGVTLGRPLVRVTACGTLPLAPPRDCKGDM